MAATPPQHDIASIVVDAASQVYHFLTQPTEPIALLPLIPPSSMPLAKQTATSSVNAVRPPPAAHAHAPTMSAIGGGGNGLWESLGIVAAVAAVELARFGWRRYRERAAIQAEDDAWQQRSRQRIKELTESLSLSPHPEGGFYRRIFESPWMLRHEACMSHAVDGRQPVRRVSPADADATTAAADSIAFHFPRPVATSIYFLLTADHPLSHLHRLPADEQWVWIEGDPLLIVQVDPATGEYSERLLGPVRLTAPHTDFPRSSVSPHTMFLQPCSTASVTPSAVDPALSRTPNGDAAASSSPLPATSIAFPTHVVPGGQWFGARLCDPARFAHDDATAAGSTGSDLLHLLSAPLTGMPAAASAPSSTTTPRRLGYTLVSCIVSPGFQFEDFRLLGLADYTALGVDEALRRRLRAAGIDERNAEEKARETREMVLNETTRGDDMDKEAQK